MLFVCVIRLFVGLSGVVLTLGANIDDATITKAKNGEWVPLPNGSEDVVKFVRSNVVGTGTFTYKQLDDFCEKEDSLFVPFPSEEDKKFLIEVARKIEPYGYLFLGDKSKEGRCFYVSSIDIKFR